MTANDERRLVIMPIHAAARRGAWIDLALITLVWIAMAILINPIGDFAINDDFTYKLAVERVLLDGSFALPSGSTANVVMHAYWGALFCLPFGLSHTALRISTLTLAVIGLWATYGTAREMGARRSLAVATAGTFAVAPLYLPLAASFMTDVPFTSLAAIAFYLFARGMRRPQPGFVAMGIAVALAMIMLRQIGLLFAIAFGVALVAQARGSLRSIAVLVAIAAFGLALHLGFQHWMLATQRMRAIVIGSTSDFGPGLNPKMIAIAIAEFMVLMPYLGLMMLPLYCATGFSTPRAFFGERPGVALGLALLTIGAQLAAAWNRQMHFPDYGNVLSSKGIGPMLIYDRWLLGINQPAAPLPAWIWTLIFLIGTVAVAAIVIDLAAALFRLIGGLRRKAMHPQAWVDGAVLAIVILYGTLVCMMSVRPAAYDRYMLPFMPAIALLILAYAAPVFRWTIPRIAIFSAVTALFGLFSIAATRDGLAWHRARLQATDLLERMHIPPDRIDGGYEYNGGIFYARPLHDDWSKPFTRSWWWLYDDEYIVGAGPVPGYRLTTSFPFYRTLTRSWDRVVILHRLPGSRGEVGNFDPNRPR